MKDKITRRSRGVAFVLFLKPEDASSCAKGLNNTQVNFHQLYNIYNWILCNYDVLNICQCIFVNDFIIR